MAAAHNNNGTLVRYAAALAVVVQHGFMLAGEPDPIAGTGHFRHIGYIGVLMFFALSGYLLTTRIKQDPLPYFISSRIFRIFPLLIAVNVLTVLLGAFFTTLTLQKYFAPDAFGLIFNNIFSFGQTTLPGVAIGPVATDGHNQTMNIAQWSIFYELRSYALLVLISVMGVLANRATLNLLILFVVIIQPVQETWLHFGDWRAHEMTAMFLFGAFFACNPIKLDWKFAAVWTGIGIATDFIRLPFSSMVFDFAIAAVTVTLAFGAVPYVKFVDRLPDLTYPLYLVHWPVGLVLTSMVTLPGLALTLAICGVSFLISIPLHYLIEEPGRRIPRLFTAPRRPATPIAEPA